MGCPIGDGTAAGAGAAGMMAAKAKSAPVSGKLIAGAGGAAASVAGKMAAEAGADMLRDLLTGSGNGGEDKGGSNNNSYNNNSTTNNSSENRASNMDINDANIDNLLTTVKDSSLLDLNLNNNDILNNNLILSPNEG